MCILSGCAATPETQLRRAYEDRWAKRLVPMLTEVVRFPTYAGNDAAFLEQKAWLARTARDLGFGFRDAGKVVEIDLPAAPGAPVLGLVLHGDVVPAAGNWTFPAFEATLRDGMVRGRGVVDDKGPLVQALLAVKVLQESGRPRTHTVRILVGSDEETAGSDMKEYLAAHVAPHLSLVLDATFPVLVGEKAFNMLRVDAALDDRGPGTVRLASLDSGIAGNIIPDLATATLEGTPEALEALQRRLESKRLPAGTRLEARRDGVVLTLQVRGKAAHSGVNAEGGRNALLAMAELLDGSLPAGGASDLIAFTRVAGQDLQGTGLGLTTAHPIFGRAVAAPTMVRRQPDGKLRLFVNIRSNPGESGKALEQLMHARVHAFNVQHGARLTAGGTFTSQPFEHDPDAKIVKRLLAAYARSTGRGDRPSIGAGSTYVKRLPNSIVYGMWFPGQPYPGHDVDEMTSEADLHLGTLALIEALADLACSEPIPEPFKP